MIEPAPPAPTDDQARSASWTLLARPPGLVVHGLAVVVALAVLWLYSYPGGNILFAVLSLAAVAALVATWVLRLVTFRTARGEGNATGSPARFAVLPIILVVVAVLAIASVPTKARFALGRDDFDAQVAKAPVAECTAKPVEFDVPDRLGTFDIAKAYCLRDAVVFLVPGGFFSNVGFAHLPTGDFAELDAGDLEGVTFTRLTGDWYTFATED